MKKTTPNNLLVLITFLWSLVGFAQTATINVSYGSPAIPITNGGSVGFGLSGYIDFSVTNNPDKGNPSLLIQSITSNNTTNFTVSSVPFISNVNIKNFDRGVKDVGIFRITKKSYNCGTGASVITIVSNVGTFSFTVGFDNKPSISVLGGTPTQPVPNGQTVPTSTNGTLFGTVTAGATATRSFLIANTGTCPLTLSSLTCFGYGTTTQSPDFLIYLQPTPYPPTVAFTPPSNVILPGAASYFVVLFNPQSTGIKSALISIPNNDATRSPYTFVVSGEVYNPTITGPGGGNPDFRLWLKSTRGVNLATGTNNVSLWKDLGSTGKDATQLDAVKRPSYIDAAIGNINYNPVIKFENNQFMGNIDNGYYTQETFIVMEPDVSIGDNTSPMTVISGTSAAHPTYSIITDEHTGIGYGDFSSRLTGEKLWFNQEQKTNMPYYTVADNVGNYSKAGIINTRNRNITGTASTGVDLLFNTNLIGSNITSYSNLGYLDNSDVDHPLWKGTPYNIGKNINSGTANGSLNGRVAEVISYASRVLDVNRPKIETYLAVKYGITLGVNGTSQNYLDSAGTIIWDSANNAGFNYNIAGIGRNVDSDLYQKQSKSGNDINEVSIGLGVIAATNSANINQFAADRNFLVWGSDNGTRIAAGSNTTTLRSGLTSLTSTVTKINKKWKIVETGGDVENVFVGIPVTAFDAFPKLPNEEYALIVSDNSTFSDTDIIDIIPLKINIDARGVPILNKEGSQTYQTWYDFDGTKYFTFGKVPKVESKELVNIGVNSFLVGEYALNLNSGSFTIGCWLRNDGTAVAGDNKTIMAKGINLELRLNKNNKIEALWDGSIRFVSNTAVADNKWHNVVAVYYLGSADLYIDGVLDASIFNLTNPTPNYSRFSVGALYASKSDIRTPFYGEIDEIHIWNMALSSRQVNYLMNQEIEKYGDYAKGKELPQDIASNEIKTIPWATLVAYYDFNSFYGTTVEGLTAERNFLRIKYLNKNKNIAGIQTAPLPYETIVDGEWNGTNSAIWKNGAVQTIPNGSSLVSYTDLVNGIPETFKYFINGNIVKIKNNITSVGNKTLLGLFVDGTDTTTYKTLSANNDTKIEVSHYLKLDGLIDLKGRSQLVQTLNSELDPTSKGFIKRDQQGTVNKDNYNYWSSPVGPINTGSNNNAYTVSTVFMDGTTTTPQNINWVEGYNGSLTSPISLARYWLYKFENGSEYADWKHFIETDQINPSQGFTLKGAGAVNPDNLITQNYTFVGKPYNGLITGNTVIADNLFLVGNPYPSALDAFEFIKDNINTINVDDITGELYFWEHSPDNDTHILSEYTGGYATLTLTGGVPPVSPIGISGVGESTKLSHQYIPVGQGFFVLGKQGIIGSVPVIFNNNQRAFVKEDAVTVDITPLPISNTIFKNPAHSSKNKTADHFKDNSNDAVYNNYNTKIRLGFNTANHFHRQLLLGFMNEDATDGLDSGYDGYQIDTKSNDSYFLINDSEYTIQGVGAFDVAKKYPLGVITNLAGTVKFMVDETEFLPLNQKIYLHDKETSLYYDITGKPAEINLLSGTYNTRFEVTFQTDKSLATEQNELAEPILMIYNNEIKKKLFITKNETLAIKEISIYNLTGQRIITLKEIPELNTIEIPFNVQHGTYVVKLLTDKGIISKKVLKQ